MTDLNTHSYSFYSDLPASHDGTIVTSYHLTPEDLESITTVFNPTNMTTKQPAEWEVEMADIYFDSIECPHCEGEGCGIDHLSEVIKLISQIETAAVQRGVTMALQALPSKKKLSQQGYQEYGFNSALTQSRENITNLLTKIA